MLYFYEHSENCMQPTTSSIKQLDANDSCAPTLC